MVKARARELGIELTPEAAAETIRLAAAGEMRPEQAAAGLAAFTLILPLAGVILLILALVTASYRQVVMVYTQRGGFLEDGVLRVLDRLADIGLAPVRPAGTDDLRGVVVDSRAQCIDHGEAGWAVRAGLLEPASLIELGALLTAPIDFAAQEIVVADLTGVAVQDVAIAKSVWSRLTQAP